MHNEDLYKEEHDVEVLYDEHKETEVKGSSYDYDDVVNEIEERFGVYTEVAEVVADWYVDDYAFDDCSTLDGLMQYIEENLPRMLYACDDEDLRKEVADAFDIDIYDDEDLEEGYLREMADFNSNYFGKTDIGTQRMYSALSGLNIRDRDWDVKGSKFTIRLSDKLVICLVHANEIKVCNEDTLLSQIVHCQADNFNADIVSIINAIQSI